MKLFRTVLFWCHLGVGAAVAAVVLVMSVTGVLLTYQRQVTAWADVRGLDGAPPAGSAGRLPAARLLEGIPAEGAARPTALTWRADPDAPVQVAFGRERVVYVNAYTGAILGEGSAGVRRFFRVVTDWHRWLGRPDESRALGKSVTGAANLGFLFLVLSGLYLWWPRNRTRQTFRGVLWFRRGLRGKARDFNWHHVVGFWSALPLVVVVASGVVISYRWAGDLVYRAAGEAPPPRSESPGSGRAGPGRDGAAEAGPSLAGVDPLLARAGRQVPGWRSITLQVPREAGDSVRFTVDRGDGGQPQERGQLVLQRGTGAVLAWEPFSAATPGRRARMVLRFAHTGEVLGLAGQTVAGLVSLGAAVLVWTGLALSLRRLRSWGQRRGGVPAPRGARREGGKARRREYAA